MNISLNIEEKQALEGLYLFHKIPTDQLKRNPSVLEKIAATFHLVSGRNIEPEKLHRYMINRRKKKDWPKLGREYVRFESPKKYLCQDDYSALRICYADIGVSIDEYLFRPELVSLLEKKFAAIADKVIGGQSLIAAMMTERKSGNWSGSEDQAPMSKQKPFSDIEEVLAERKSQAIG